MWQRQIISVVANCGGLGALLRKMAVLQPPVAIEVIVVCAGPLRSAQPGIRIRLVDILLVFFGLVVFGVVSWLLYSF